MFIPLFIAIILHLLNTLQPKASEFAGPFHPLQLGSRAFQLLQLLGHFRRTLLVDLEELVLADALRLCLDKVPLHRGTQLLGAGKESGGYGRGIRTGIE